MSTGHDWTFGLLPETDVANLCGVDATLLGGAATTRTDSEWLHAVLDWVAGKRTYEGRIRAAVESDDRSLALDLATSAATHGVQLPEDLVHAVDIIWTRQREETNARKASASGLFANRDVGTSELAELVALVLAELEQATVPELRPLAAPALQQARASIENIRRLAAEADGLVAELEKERAARVDKLRATTKTAALKLAELLFHEDADKRNAAADVLRGLPALAQDGRLDDLKAISDGRLDVSTPRSEARPLPRDVPFVTAAVAQSSVRPDVTLSRMSQSVVEKTMPGAAVTTAEELARLRRDADTQPLRRRAQMLLAGARAASSAPLVNALLGDGLLATAERYLFEEGNARLAQFCASDAVAAISASDEHYQQENAEQAVAVLLLCRLWPKLQAHLRKGAIDPAALRGDLESLVSWIEERGELETVAQVWSRVRSPVAREVLDAVGPFTSSVTALWMACALALIRQEVLIDEPETVIEKLVGLLAPSSPSEVLRAAFERVGRELAAADRGKIPSASRNEILRDLALIEAEVVKLPDTRPAPRDVVAERFPAVVRYLVDAPAPDARAQLSITQPIEAIFIADRSDEVRIPVVIENDPRAGAARDLHVQVSFDREGSTAIELLEPREQPLAHLDPGESDERSFYCNIRKIESLARADLKVVVRMGVEIVTKHSMSITLRHDSRRDKKSPFQPGIALEVDEGFVGRERQRKLISDALLADAVRVPLVVGIRRVGKTSLLHAIRREPRIEARYATKYVSFESRPSSDNSVALLIHVAETLREVLGIAAGKSAVESIPFSREDFRQDPYAAFERFTSAIEVLAPKRGLLLVIDEFDKLLSIVERGKQLEAARGAPLQPHEVLQPEVFGALRSMIMRGRAIRVMIAGLPRLLRNMGYEDRFFNMLEPVRVLGFTEEEAREVINFAGGVMHLTPSAQTRVLRASGGQPYLLQVICHGLFNHMLEEGRNVATRGDVDEVIERDVLPTQSYFTDFADLMDAESLSIVRTIARLQRVAPSRLYVSVSEIEAALASSGVVVADLRARLADLISEDRPLLERPANQQLRYRLTIGLLADHLLR